MIKEIKFIALETGKKKDGGNWNKVTLRALNSEEKYMVDTFWIDDRLAKSIAEQNIPVDAKVQVNLGFNDRFKSDILSVSLIK